MKNRGQWLTIVLAAWCGIAGITGCAAAGKSGATKNAKSDEHTSPLIGCQGTYNAAPRLKNGRVDIERLLGELGEIRANTYNWMIWHAATDWDDLQQFLPLARRQGLRVWVTLVPPSESPPKAKNYSEPYRLDYKKWAEEIAKLSVREPNLVAWSIDDYVHNLKVYTPEYMREIRAVTKGINPKLAFVPCCYYKQTTPQFAEQYQGLVDGVLFPYRNESVKANLTDAGQVEQEVLKFRSLFGKGVPIIVDVYATRHSRLGDSTPEYVKDVMKAGKCHADGVLVYCHQDKQKSAAKYQVIKDLFIEWATGVTTRPAK